MIAAVMYTFSHAVRRRQKKRGAEAPLSRPSETSLERVGRPQAPETATRIVRARYIAVDVGVAVADRDRHFLVEGIVEAERNLRVPDTAKLELEVHRIE
jgi:hypothetical protein